VFFKQGTQSIVKALFKYSEAIEILEKDGDSDADSTEASSEDAETPKYTDEEKNLLKTLYSNRAFCNIKLESYGSAIADASKAIIFDPDFTKAHYRRGCAHLGLLKFKEAKSDFTKVVKLSPSDKDAREKYKFCDAELKAQKFARAIATEDPQPLSERIALDEIPLESGYEGPVFTKGEPLALEFLDGLLNWQKDQKILAKRCAYELVMAAIELFKKDRSVVHVTVPPNTEFTVCGDIHGQYYDLLNIWEINGKPSESNPYLFNGDFVDRGSFSVECIIALIAFKVAYPGSLFLSRGNHETKAMNRMYGFSGEVQNKFDDRLYELFSELFCWLPLAHVINRQVFTVHGGLFSKDGVQLSELDRIERNCEPPDAGHMVEMLWSDPQPMRGRNPSKRGVGVNFGPDVTDNFLSTNGLKMIVRSHEMKEKGYEIDHGGKLVTVFSAPNYCDQMGNEGAFIRFKADATGDLTPHYRSFSNVEHPPVRAMQYANRALFGPMFGQQ
jgi:serine/threonine-protein phosphatase 5